MAENSLSRRVPGAPLAAGGDNCRVCGRQTFERMKLRDGGTEVPVPLCEVCRRQPVNYALRGDRLIMADAKTGEVLARHPIVYRDSELAEMQKAGRIGEWIESASPQALIGLWEITHESQAMLARLQYQIAAEFHQRLGFRGGGWVEEAAKVLRREGDVVRNYAYIWERLGGLIEEDPRRLELGYSLLRSAAFARGDPREVLDHYQDERDGGRPVAKILREGCKEHDYACRRCGRKMEEIQA